MKIAVKCDTPEQKYAVVKYSGRSEYTPTSDCVNLETGQHGSEKWYKSAGYEIISYADFERDYLKKNTMKIREYYCSKGGWIFIHVDPHNYKCNNFAMYPEIRKYFPGNAAISGVNNDTTARLATPEERKWLDACIKAGKFIPKEEALKELTKFEVGKWYKGWKDSDCKFAKFHHVNHTNHGDYFHWTAAVHKNWGKLAHTDNEASCNWSHEPDNLVEASLEEVQIHLPEGHPDKIKSITKNVKDLVYPDVVHIETLEQWNKIKEHHKITNHDPEYKYYLIGAGGGMAKERRDYENIKSTVYNIIEFSDIKFPGLQYAEDYSPKEEKPMKFKVGESVSFVSLGMHIPKWYCDPDIPRDKVKHGSIIFKKNVGKIEEIYKNFYIVSFIDENGKTVQLGFKEDALKKAESMKPVDFEGRWVKCLKSYANDCEVNGKPVEAGKYYQLTSKVISCREGELSLKDGNYCGFASWGENQEMWKTIDFELMPEGFVPPKESLHDMLVSNKLVGRYIKALIDNPHGGVVKAGEVGKVIKNNIVDFPSQKGYFVGQNDTDNKYELMPEGWTPDKPKKESWKVGDWAFVTGEFEDRDSTGPEKFKRGEVFKVIQIEDSFLVASGLWLRKSPSEFIGSGACRKATAGEIPAELAINVPKYVECINSVTNWLEIGEVYEYKEEKGTFSWKYKNGHVRKAFPEEIPKENSGYNPVVSEVQWDKNEWKGAVIKERVELYIPKKRRRIDPSVTRVNSLRGEVKQPKKVVLF